MAIETFDDLYNKGMEYYRNQQYADALDLLTREGERFPEDAPMVLYLRSCMAARVGQPDMALDLMQESLDKGYWYGEQVMRESPSFQSLQGLPRFEKMVEICKARHAEYANADPVLLTLEPEGDCPPEKPCPLLIALHGNGSNARASIQAWRCIVSNGWLLAAPQSSQAVGMRAFIWDDQETALREVKEHYSQLCTQHAIDAGNVVIAGFSMGGETALRAALSGTVPARGFVLLGPGGPTILTPDAWLPLIEEAKARNLRGYILLGEQDEGVPHDEIRALAKLLNENGIPCELEMVPGIAHEYPRDFAPYAARALAFVREA
ncbi:MAG: dienelactone hydrolase family protein [Chloroflexota bacterium]|nr:dienelactone hydrolase family protein [Chloroflexota bacterium]